jgi:hypothetical protein
MWYGAAVATLVLAAGCGAPQQKAAESTAPGAAVAEGDVGAVKDAFDTDETTGVEAPKTKEELEAARKAYSPFAGKTYPRLALFGDTHNHTANSGDAYMAGTTLTPEQAYRFARGEEVVSSTGVSVRLSRPLDFLVVADHAEGLGIMYQVQEGNPGLVSDPLAAQWSKVLKNGTPAEKATTTNDVVKAQAMGTLPKTFKDPKVVGPIMKSVWQQYTATAEKFNEPGRFSAVIGYEWTSVPGGNNLHRNVIFRDDKDKADQVFPFSAWNSEDPEKLYEWMAAYEKKTGGQMLAIPHNGNLSNGRMFELVDFGGNPLSRDYAEKRARYEVLQEIIQTKGNSETHPILAPNDEFAGDLGVAGWEYGNLTLTEKPLSADMMQTNYLRAGLLRGLEQEAKLGTNPFKFGFVGSTDVHNSLTAIEEDNFFGKLRSQEPSAKRWEHKSKESSWDAAAGPTRTRYTWHYMAAGYAVVWATENTRTAIWDAMKRREAYGTSGSRIVLRFFGGWNYDKSDARSRFLAEAGYEKGVPMGSDLPPSPAATASQGRPASPTFLVAAMKDSRSGNLDRIQIVKGWLGKDGKAQEKVYDVVWGDADRRKVDRKGKLAPVGDTVDVATATWTNTIGDPELSAVWTDPDFDPSVRAFYYARVIEIPTPRWTAYDAARFGIKMPPEVPMKVQERAWASPIWYTPAK